MSRCSKSGSSNQDKLRRDMMLWLTRWCGYPRSCLTQKPTPFHHIGLVSAVFVLHTSGRGLYCLQLLSSGSQSLARLVDDDFQALLNRLDHPDHIWPVKMMLSLGHPWSNSVMGLQLFSHAEPKEPSFAREADDFWLTVIGSRNHQYDVP